MGKDKRSKTAANVIPKLFFPDGFISLLSYYERHSKKNEAIARLIEMADHCIPGRLVDPLSQIAVTLAELSLPTHLRGADSYYKAIAVNGFGKGNDGEASRLLYDVAENATSPLYRARAYTALGVVAARQLNDDDGLRLHSQARQLLRTNNVNDVIVESSFILTLARYQSLCGDHRISLCMLYDFFGQAKSWLHKHPPQYYAFLNSLAFETYECGEMETAGQIIEPVLRSPYIFNYPEWDETGRDIHAALRPRPCMIGGTTFESRREAAPHLMLVRRVQPKEEIFKLPDVASNRVIPFKRPKERHRDEPELRISILLNSQETGSDVVFCDSISNARLEDAVKAVSGFQLNQSSSPVRATITCTFASGQVNVFAGPVGEEGLDDIFAFCDAFRETEEIV